MNMTVVTGRLVKRTPMGKFNNGTPYINFTLASDRPFKNKDGQYGADFIHCYVTGQSASFLEKYAEKGSLIGLQGPIRTDTKKDLSGNTQFFWTVYSRHAELMLAKGQHLNK